jgi:cytochrome c-type biogenesis protein CcmE
MNKKKKILLSFTSIVSVFFKRLCGIDISEVCLKVSELISNHAVHFGQNVNVTGVVEYGGFEETPEMNVSDLKDKNNENSKIHGKYTGNLPSRFAEGKKVNIKGIGIFGSTFEANKIIARCSPKYTE